MNERSIFAAAADIADPSERAAYLDKACAGDNDLRSHIEELIAAQSDLGSFLNRPVAVNQTVTIEKIVEGPGSVIGRYKLLQQIGEGGFGSVYMAEQREPVKRRVAVKIIKLGMDTREVVARFEAERQALALMDHLNIAKVLDAGATDTGRPFFVMELVKGVPITEFCDLNHLPTADRLGLSCKFAGLSNMPTEKGIIHRDIKPSNVLVTLHDGKPVPKIIDFGVAKALNQELTEKTLFTAHGQMIGTPQYMSPEQAEMSGLDIDIRADIYSLGVLLYELLTGTTPLEAASLRKTAYADMQRLIKEQEAPRPSHRISTLGERLSAVARDRGCEPGRFGALLRGDLDWVVLKALEKERGRRYESADGFAADVQRFLGNEPVEAHPPSLAYRVRKFVRRNRGPVVAAAAMIVLLCLGLAGTVNRMIAARHEAERALQAEVEAAKARDAALAARDDAERARKGEANERAAAQRERQIAVKAADERHRHLYVSTANHIQAAWNANNPSRVQELLDQQRPAPGEEDLRNFEWHYFDRLMHAELRSVKLEFNPLVKVQPGPGGQGRPFLRMVFSADGARYATRSTSTVDVWDLATGRNLLPVSVRQPKVGKPGSTFDKFGPGGFGDFDTRNGFLVGGLTTTIGNIDLSRDGQRLALSYGTEPGGPTKQSETRIVVWDVGVKKQRKTILVSDALVTFALSPDGRRLAVVAGKTRPIGEPNPDDIKNPDPVIKIWDLGEDKEPLEFKRPLVSLPHTQLTFAADGKSLILRSFIANPITDPDEKKPIRVTTFETATGKELTHRQLGIPENDLSRIATFHSSSCSADGSRMVAVIRTNQITPTPTSGRDQVVVWETASGKQLSNFQPEFNGNYRAVISPDGKRIAFWSTQNPPIAQLWSADTGLLLAKIEGHTAPITELEFHADGARLFSVDDSGTFKEWDVQELERNASGRDRALLAMPAKGPGLDMQVAITSKDRSRTVVAMILSGGGFGGKVGFRKSSGNESSDIRVRDASGRELRTFSGHKAPLAAVAISADGRHVISIDRAKEQKVWETTATGRVLLSLSWEGKVGIAGVQGFASASASSPMIARAAFSPDGRRLAAALPDGGMKVWDLNGFREIFAAPDDVVSVRWMPDGRGLLALSKSTGGGGFVTFDLKHWNVDTGKELYSRTIRSSRTFFSRDGMRLVSIVASNIETPESSAEIEVLDVSTGAELPIVKTIRGRIAAGYGAVTFTPDGTRLAVITEQEILIADVATGKEVFRLKGSAQLAGNLAFSPDGKRLVSSTLFGGRELILWDMATGGELMRLPGSPGVVSFSADGHRLEIGGDAERSIPPTQIFDGTPRTVSPK